MDGYEESKQINEKIHKSKSTLKEIKVQIEKSKKENEVLLSLKQALLEKVKHTEPKAQAGPPPEKKDEPQASLPVEK